MAGQGKKERRKGELLKKEVALIKKEADVAASSESFIKENHDVVDNISQPEILINASDAMLGKGLEKAQASFIEKESPEAVRSEEEKEKANSVFGIPSTATAFSCARYPTPTYPSLPQPVVPNSSTLRAIYAIGYQCIPVVCNQVCYGLMQMPMPMSRQQLPYPCVPIPIRPNVLLHPTYSAFGPGHSHNESK